jgi:hypothetical protein
MRGGTVALAVVAVILGVGLLSLLLGQSTPPTSDAELALFPSPSIDPGFPEFPLPVGSTLVSASIEGDGASAYRTAAWNSPATYDATESFYATASYGRWQLEDLLVLDRDATSFVFADVRDEYRSAQLTLARTDPVRIQLRLVPWGEVAAPTFPLEGSPFAVATLPLSTDLPASLPASLQPPNSQLVDSAEASGVVTASWQTRESMVALSDYYAEALSFASLRVTRDSAATVILYSDESGSGTIVLEPTSNGTNVYLEWVQ